MQTKNPFAVQTPESMPADEVLSLFVEELTDYPHILDQSHSIIFGPRGAGKSMIFRFMEPDCQTKYKRCVFGDLGFFGVYIPVKDASLDVSELERFEKAKFSPYVINEHLLVAHVASRLFKSLEEKVNLERTAGASISAFWSNDLLPRLKRSGVDVTLSETEVSNLIDGDFSVLRRFFDTVFEDGIAYINRSGFLTSPEPYTGALLGYGAFLKPVLMALSELDFMPDGPIYLLFDDADNLNRIQTEILNSWIASRTTGQFCIKASAETLKFKTLKTPNGRRIEVPHDFQEIKIEDIYTSKFDTYKDRITKIVEKRLRASGIIKTAAEFFPPNLEQEKKISSIAKMYRSQTKAEARGFRASDDAVRYSRPDYIKGLKGKSKSGPTYSYAGFDQLVHVSSGVIRNFLDPASDMFSEMISIHSEGGIDQITHQIQDKVLKSRAKKMLVTDFSDMKSSQDDSTEVVKKLNNLVGALGGMFYEILVSESSERRVFSIAFSTGPDDEIQEVLDLGVGKGYFHQSSIGNKKGNGRVPMYILSRRLAPAFTLDPTSFAGYKFVTNDKILAAIHKPSRLIELVRINGFESAMNDGEQGDLFE
jgi:hypothetical protein